MVQTCAQITRHQAACASTRPKTAVPAQLLLGVRCAKTKATRTDIYTHRHLSLSLSLSLSCSSAILLASSSCAPNATAVVAKQHSSCRTPQAFLKKLAMSTVLNGLALLAALDFVLLLPVLLAAFPAVLLAALAAAAAAASPCGCGAAAAAAAAGGTTSISAALSSAAAAATATSLLTVVSTTSSSSPVKSMICSTPLLPCAGAL
jgi:hypothetical protein